MATGRITKLIEETIERMEIGEHVSFLPGEKHFFEENFEPIEVRKGDYLIKRGSEVNYFYFLEEGIMKLSFPNSKGSDINARFIQSREFINFYLMHLNAHKAHYNIKANTHSKLWRMHKSRIQILFNQSLNFNKLARIHLERSLQHRILREESIHCLNAQQRYDRLMEKERWLFRHLPLKELASYIGITPQAFSKVRNKSK